MYMYKYFLLSILSDACGYGYDKQCVNYNGGYQCICKDGYYMNGTSCMDVNECLNVELYNDTCG